MQQRSSTAQRLRAVIVGDVQGVGYRYFARREAQSRGLGGFVRNLADGSVEVVAEGDRAQLEALVHVLERGPGAATVEQVDCAWSEATLEFSGFSIRY